MGEFSSKIKNHMIVVFGATGSLMKNKLLRSFYSLYEKGLITQTTPIVCVGRKKLTKNSFIDLIEPEKNIPGVNNMILSGFLQLINYVKADFDTGEVGSLASTIEKLDKKNRCMGNRIFYLATPPYLFQTVSEKIDNIGLTKGKGWKRIIYEKPLGADFKTSNEINKNISRIFDENQIYRVDQFIGMENLQNVLSLRFANTIFRDVWQGKNIDNIQITFSKKEGPGQWPEFYDNYGEIRDGFYNRALQLLSLLAISEPSSANAFDISKEREKILKSIQIPQPKNIVTGQYGSGKVDGKSVKAYRQETGIDNKSATETFVAVKLGLNKGILKDVPIYIRCGKRLGKSEERVDVVFKSSGSSFVDLKSNNLNFLSILLNPKKGISLTINKDSHDDTFKTVPLSLENYYDKESEFSSMHEEVLYEVMRGEQGAFSTSNEILASWKVIDAILEKAKRKKTKFPNYSAGNDGPKDAALLLKNDKRNWVV